MKRVNKKDWERLQFLNAKLTADFENPMRQSHIIFRGDFRAIQWAAWWIREVLRENQA